MRALLKRAVLRALTLPGFTLPLAPLTRGRPVVFMLHRFCSPDHGIEGHEPTVVKAHLEYLRKHRYELVSLTDLFARLESGTERPLKRAVAFTIDDGYFDQAEIGAPIFAAYDCPVTTFITTGFLDRTMWFWWDRVAHGFTSTDRSDVRVPLGGETVEYQWVTATGAAALPAGLHRALQGGQRRRETTGHQRPTRSAWSGRSHTTSPAVHSDDVGPTPRL